MGERTRLNILLLAPFAPRPASFGAQRRVAGLMSELSRRHELTAVCVVDADDDDSAVRREMRGCCSELILIARPGWDGPRKRLLQARSLLSSDSLLRRLYDLPALRRALHGLLSTRQFDVVNVELPYLAAPWLSSARPEGGRPRLVLDEHNIEFDLARQQAGNEMALARRVYNAVNWRKIRREERTLWREWDGVAFCSAADQARARSLVPAVRSAVVPNAVDVAEFRVRPTDASPDGRTVLFFGALNYFPNEDGVLHLLREIWPRIEQGNPAARLKIIGQQPTREILASQGPRIEVLGKVDDLRPHLATAAVTIAPLRVGGGTRFKILEAMAMSRPVVSTSVGAEGIDAEPGRHLLRADDPASFAGAVLRILGDPALGRRLGEEARALVEARYSWAESTRALEALYRQALTAVR